VASDNRIWSALASDCFLTGYWQPNRSSLLHDHCYDQQLGGESQDSFRSWQTERTYWTNGGKIKVETNQPHYKKYVLLPISALHRVVAKKQYVLYGIQLSLARCDRPVCLFLGFAQVFDQGNKFVCTAHAHQIAHWGCLLHLDFSYFRI
jgi:hypothetical protein